MTRLFILFATLAMALPGWAGTWSADSIEAGKQSTYTFTASPAGDDSTRHLTVQGCMTNLIAFEQDIDGTSGTGAATIYACPKADTSTPATNCTEVQAFSGDNLGVLKNVRPGFLAVDVTTDPGAGETSRLTVYCSASGQGTTDDQAEAKSACLETAVMPEMCSAPAVFINDRADFTTAVATAFSPVHARVVNSITYTTTTDPSASADFQIFGLQLNAEQIPITDVNTTTEVLTSAAHGFSVGDGPFRLDADTTIPTPGRTTALYYIASVPSTTTFTLKGPDVNGLLEDPLDFSTTGTLPWIAPIPKILLTCAPGVELVWNHDAAVITADSGNNVTMFSIESTGSLDSSPERTFVQVEDCVVIEKRQGIEQAISTGSGTTVEGFAYHRSGDDTEFRHSYLFRNNTLRSHSTSSSTIGMGHASINVSGTMIGNSVHAAIGLEIKGECDSPALCEDLWSYVIDNDVTAIYEGVASARIWKLDLNTNVYSRGNRFHNGSLQDERTTGWWVSEGDTHENCGRTDANHGICLSPRFSGTSGGRWFVRGFTFINPQPAGRYFLFNGAQGGAVDFQGRVEGETEIAIPNELVRFNSAITTDPTLVLVDIESDTDLGKDLDTVDAAADVDTTYIRMRFGTERVVFRGDGTRIPVSGNDTVVNRIPPETTWGRRPGSLVLSSSDMDTGDEACAPLICADIADGVGDGLDADDCTTDHPDGDTFMPICRGLTLPVVPANGIVQS